MKNLMLALTVVIMMFSYTCSFGLADVFCPASVTCFQDNNYKYCVINETNGHWTFDNVPPSFLAGNFLFSGAYYDTTTKIMRCTYISNRVKNNTLINLVPSDFLGSPDTMHGNGNFTSTFWTKNKNLMTCYIDGRLNCPIIK